MATVGVAEMRRADRELRKRGMALAPEAVKEVARHVAGAGDPVAALTEVADVIKSLGLPSAVVPAAAAKAALAQLRPTYNSRDGGSHASTSERLRIVDAFSAPAYQFDPVCKTFKLARDEKVCIGDADAKIKLYKERFLLLQHRVLQNPMFQKPALGNDDSCCELTPISSLKGARGMKYVMGAIAQLRDGELFLEDTAASVPIDIAEAIATAGFFTENTIIVAEGDMQASGTFKISAMGMPPMESNNEMSTFTSGVDLFGAGLLKTNDRARLQDLEQAHNDMFVILSDVCIEQPQVMNRLQQILDGYESLDEVPALFVLMGNFGLEAPSLAHHNARALRERFTELGRMIQEHENIHRNSTFLFIPGPGDPGPANVLPRPALPSTLTKGLRELVPTAIFASNPCRVRHYAQDMVFFCEDLMHKLRKQCVLPPSTHETAEPFEHLVSTVLRQSHLCPLPLHLQPVYWSYDHSLRLYPVPDLLVLGNRSEQKDTSMSDCCAVNPGSFSVDGTFVVYRPSAREVECSAVE